MTTLHPAHTDSERQACEAVRRRLIGAWTLVSYTATSADGHVIHPLGPAPQGLIVYTADGHMSAQLSRGDRPATGSERLEDSPPEELARTAVTYVAYGGPSTSWTRPPSSTTSPPACSRLGGTAPGAEGDVRRHMPEARPGHPVRMWGGYRTAELTWRKPY
ncbi:hypothetical protein E4K10_01340 [Streptomyces sp. T1317-0309]|nr:hypothetical protein E4K10_01340 [Streptomyces sp. T1317-0309]